MRELSFNIEAARRFGVDGAIMLQGMAAWISKNRANELCHCSMRLEFSRMMRVLHFSPAIR